MADTSKPANGGNGGGDGLLFGIVNPSKNAAVVGVNKGVPITVIGTFDWVPKIITNLSVEVSLGGTASNASLSGPDDSDQVTWTYHGLTTIGGPITIEAALKQTIPPNTIKELASASVAVVVNDNPALSSTIDSPADGSTIKTWLGPTVATGTATFDGTITSPQLVVSVDGRARTAALDAGTISDSQIVYHWSCPLVFVPAESGQSVPIQTTAQGGFTDSQGHYHDVPQQIPAIHKVTVQIDTTFPVVHLTSPSADFQTPDDPNGAKVMVTGTVTDPEPSSGIKSVIVSGDVTAPVTAKLMPGGGWSANVTLNPITNPSDRGQRNLLVQAWDNESNPGNATVTVYLETTFQPYDQNESLSLLGYLRDLLSFATRRITDPTKFPAANLELADLARNFYQPFHLLSQDEEVHQTRLCIEVLRKWMAPVGYWKFDENTGNSASDSSGNNLNGTLKGAAGWGPGKSGSAVTFDGATAYVQIGNVPQLRVTTAVSIAAWIFPTGPGSLNVGGVIVSKAGEYVVARFPDGSVRWGFANVQPGWEWVNTQYTAPLNQWTHILVRYANGVVDTYADGQRVHSYFGAGTIGTADQNSHDFRIGDRQEETQPPQFFEGQLDEVSVYDRVLSDEEITALFKGTPVSSFADAQAAYGLAAYQELLLELGTSYQELRLARLADANTRASLAARLGIDLESTRPDKLDTLLLQPGNIPESQLEQLFGLIDSTRNPLSLPREPAILAWQKAHLRSLWKQQDYAPDADPNFPVPLIDPDLLVEADFVPPTANASNPALDLWNTRTAWVSSQLVDLHNDRSPGETDQARLARLVGRLKLGPPNIVIPVPSMKILLGLDNQYNNGTRIDDRLSRIPLSFPAFSYVIRLYNLAASGPLLADEWETLYSILVQVLKVRQFNGWRLLEAQSGPITIDPALFQLNFDAVSLPEWRATAQARSKWQRTLAGRTAQLDTVTQALQAAVNSAEESVLPELRDALLAAIKVPTSVPTLFSTGIVAAGLTLADSAVDPHWTITASPTGSGNAYATINNKDLMGPSWMPNTPLSRWISPKPDESGGDDPGSYIYKTSFDLTGFDLASVRVRVKVAVDNDLADVKLNGTSLNFTASGFAAFTPLPTITAGFVQGTNTLEFITNNGGASANPSGFRVEFTSAGVAQASPDWLSERLLIDVESSGALKTTRVSQAIETLQEVLSSVRAGRFGIPGNLGKIASWKIATDIAGADFDADLKWTGSWAGWYAAMEVFLYPENALAPSYQQNKSDAFAAVLDYLRMNPPLSESLASLVDKLYLYFSTVQPNDDQAQNWKDGLQYVKDLIKGSLQDADLAKLRDVIQPELFNEYKAAPPPAPPWALRYWDIFYFVPVQLALQLQLAGRFEEALRCLGAVYAYDLTGEDRKIFYGLKAEEQPANPGYSRADNWIRDLDPHGAIAPTRPNCYARFTLMSIARCFLDFADSEFTHATPESLPQARDLYLNALELLALPEMQPLNNGFQPNPVPQALATHALNNLAKLRNGLNIAGAKSVANPSIASGGAQLSLQANPSPQPTAYRYATLIERAKQLNQLAQQVEDSYFAALQQQDVENYNLLKANQDLELAGANLNLQALQVVEANDGVTLARDQKVRAQTQFDSYNNWILAGPLDSESDMIQSYKDGNIARDWVAVFGVAVTEAQAITSACAASLGIEGSFAAAASVGVLATAQAIAQAKANEAETRAQIDSANASFERRQQEWQLQSSLAYRDVTIGQDNIQLAYDKVDIANQQQLIAGIQDTHARAMVNFLSGKFTNVELYEWMSGVLGGVYRYFLQQSTAMALLAEDQLSFERQQPNLAVIKTDYWQPPSQPTTQSASGGTPVDTRGLTGSARLLEDITQLDQYAFLTDSRKLQLTKTMSLARLYPFEFQQFRETGVLPFATPMSLFDGDFPGHYLRLIKSARVSVVALIPPNQGIKATLSTTGISRVTIGGDVFQTIAVGRMPESIALTSPANASGLFELDAQPELLLPFEGTGVDTSWEFRMPLAANLFDYSTIADVLLTVDYTALDSYDYRQQVIQQLERGTSLDRAFSFRQDFADQWYELNNPDQQSVPFSIQFSTTEADFPPNIDELAIQNVLLHFVHAENQIFEVVALLTLAGHGGAATSIDGTISIRRGNASAWSVPMVGMPPMGNWVLTLQDSDSSSGPGIRTLFATGAIQDILVVITYTGKLPAWD